MTGNFGEIFLNLLKTQGVEHIFCSPGTEWVSVWEAQSDFPKEHPLHLGYNASGELKQADTVIVAGATTPWYPPSVHPPRDTKVVLIDDDPLKIRLPYHGYAERLEGPENIESALTRALKQTEEGRPALLDVILER